MDLKERLQKFIDFQNTSATSLQILKSQLTLTENENIKLRKELSILLKHKKDKDIEHVQELACVRQENAKLTKNCDYLKEKMEETLKQKQTLEKNIELFSAETDKTLVEKNKDIAFLKGQTANLNKLLFESQGTVETLKERCKNLVRNRDMCMKGKDFAIKKNENIIAMLKERLQQQVDEIDYYKEKNKTLDVEIGKLKNKSCDYCGL